MVYFWVVKMKLARYHLVVQTHGLVSGIKIYLSSAPQFTPSKIVTDKTRAITGVYMLFIKLFANNTFLLYTAHIT